MGPKLAQEILSVGGVIVDEDVLQQPRSLIECPVAEWTHPSGFDNNPSCLLFNHSEDDEYDGECDYSFYCYSCKTIGPLWRIPLLGYEQTGDEALRKLAYRAFEESKREISNEIEKRTRKIGRWGVNRVAGLQHNTARLDKEFDRFLRDALNSKNAKKYLQTRKIPKTTTKTYKLKYDPHNQRLLFPVTDEKGHVQTFVGRSVAGNKRYYNYLNVPTENLVGGIALKRPSQQSCILFEGYFDLLRQAEWCHANDMLPLCVFKSTVSNNQLDKIVRLDMPVLIAFDGDEAGRTGTMKALSIFKELCIPCRPVWLRDGEDPGGITSETFARRLKESEQQRDRSLRTPKKTTSKTPRQSNALDRLLK